MSNTSSLQALRKPVRSLQETCAFLFGNRSARGADSAHGADTLTMGAAASHDDASTQWAPTHWSETSIEPHLP